MPISSYSSPFNMNHKAVTDFFNSGEYIVSEKIDGSQVSFGMYPLEDGSFDLRCRSHNAQIDIQNPGMFEKAIDTIKQICGNLMIGWTYRGEFLQKPKHNTLAYSHVPDGNIILFDIDCAEQNYISYEDMQEESWRIGLECVPKLYIGYERPIQEQLDKWLNTESILGGTLIEGVVFKNYSLFGPDKKVLMVKYVSEAFKETHNKDWKERNPNRTDVVDKIIADFGSVMRWQKVIQHLSEEDKLVNGPEDIGLLLREVSVDFEKECIDNIKEVLWNHFRKQIIRGIQQGLPEYYKQECLK